MKSSLNPTSSRSGAVVEIWKPDTIFPSLMSDDTSSMAEQLLQLFQPAELIDDEGIPSGQMGGTTVKNSHVKVFEFRDLSSVSFDTTETVEVRPKISGPSTDLGPDEKQRLINQTRKHAEEIISDAQKTAASLLEQARLEAESIRQEAYARGRAQAEDELCRAVDTAHMILDEVSVWREKAVQHSDELIIDMIQKIAHLMFDEGVVLSNVALQRNLNKVMKMAQAIGDLRIYLNPKDLSNLDPEWKRFQESLMSKKIQIIPADSILPGGCYVQGEMGVVDAQVETQLAAILETFEPDPDKAEESPV